MLCVSLALALRDSRKAVYSLLRVFHVNWFAIATVGAAAAAGLDLLVVALLVLCFTLVPCSRGLDVAAAVGATSSASVVVQGISLLLLRSELFGTQHTLCMNLLDSSSLSSWS